MIKNNVCEMNNRTKEAKPERFVSDPGRFYIKRGAHRDNGANFVLNCIILTLGTIAEERATKLRKHWPISCGPPTATIFETVFFKMTPSQL